MPKTVILTGAGRSILTTDVFAPGHPVGAISSGIRCLDRLPDLWFSIDNPRNRHFQPQGKTALVSRKCTVYVPEFRMRDLEKKHFHNIIGVHKDQGHYSPKVEFGEGIPMSHPNKTICFAIQVCMYEGFKQVVLAGCDLDDEYAHERFLDRRGKQRLKEGHDKVLEALRHWYPLAKERGCEWISWTPGSPLNSFMRYYDPQADSPIDTEAQGSATEAN
jgi:hypothetical protein